MTSISYSPPVDILLTLGEKYIRDPKWVDYVKGYEFTNEHIPQLIQMVIDQDLNWAMSDSHVRQ